MRSKDEYDALSQSIAKMNADAAKTAAIIASKIEARRQNRVEMKARINKEFESVSGKPKRNLPV